MLFGRQNRVNTTKQSIDLPRQEEIQEEMQQEMQQEMQIEVLAQNLEVPWGMAIAENEKMYVTERPGRIRVIENGVLRQEPLYTFEEPFVSYWENGLMGIALDPNHAENGYLYVMHSYDEGPQTYSRVVRLVEENGTAFIDRVLIEGIPASRIQNGGRIKIGPDGKLYITTGDVGISTLAQNLNSLSGKILRIELDGSIPQDNPFPDSPIYSYGHRNPQGLAWSEEGVLYASEHGQIAYDEINRIEAGGNYGWPIIQGYEENESLNGKTPLLSSGQETWAPAGMTFITTGPWDGKLLVANLRGEQLLAITLDETGTVVENVQALFEGQFGRIRDVVQGPDGSIYIATSNTDGREVPDEADDRIIRIIP